MHWQLFRRSLILIIPAFLLGSVAAFYLTVNRAAGTATAPATFTVAEGDGPRQIAINLQKANYLTDDRAFFLYIVANRKLNRFYPGDYRLEPGMTMKQLVALLTNPNRPEHQVTVLEGWRITDIAKEVAKKTKITEAAFLASAPVAQYEGYLFPDTYSFTDKTTAAEAVQKMRENFDRRTAGLNLTADDVILASIVEREARTDTDRPQVAGVYLNRLAIGMALQADPTIQYAKGNWEPVTVAEYRSVISPYNTYLHNGLPPGPISNPGLKALQAVKKPDQHGYYYFIHTADGSTYYAKTLDEHNANKNKYLR